MLRNSPPVKRTHLAAAHCGARAARYSPGMDSASDDLLDRIVACDLCAAQFAGTATAHRPRPVLRVAPGARILIAGQAPGARVHASGLPFDDPSGDRLRDWMGIGRETFYDRSRVAVVPMAFCFPGYDAKGADLPPPPVCARTWRKQVLARLPRIELTLLVGQYSQRWHLGAGRAGGVTETVRRWREFGQGLLPLPHPSWRNTGWLKKNPWFAEEVLPWLRSEVARLVG